MENNGVYIFQCEIFSEKETRINFNRGVEGLESTCIGLLGEAAEARHNSLLTGETRIEVGRLRLDFLRAADWRNISIGFKRKGVETRFYNLSYFINPQQFVCTTLEIKFLDFLPIDSFSELVFKSEIDTSIRITLFSARIYTDPEQYGDFDVLFDKFHISRTFYDDEITIINKGIFSESVKLLLSEDGYIVGSGERDHRVAGNSTVVNTSGNVYADGDKLYFAKMTTNGDGNTCRFASLINGEYEAPIELFPPSIHYFQQGVFEYYHSCVVTRGQAFLDKLVVSANTVATIFLHKNRPMFKDLSGSVAQYSVGMFPDKESVQVVLDRVNQEKKNLENILEEF